MKLKKVENFVDDIIFAILVLLPWILIDLLIILILIFTEPTLIPTISVLIFIGVFLESMISITVGSILLKKKTKKLGNTLLLSKKEEKIND